YPVLAILAIPAGDDFLAGPELGESGRIQGDAERGANVFFGRLDENFAEVIVFDDALGQGQTQPPAPFSGCESRLEHHRYFRTRYPPARVRHIDKNLAFAAS